MGLSDFWHLAPTIRARVGQLGAQAAVGIGLTRFLYLASEDASRFVLRGSCWRYEQSSLNWHAGIKI